MINTLERWNIVPPAAAHYPHPPRVADLRPQTPLLCGGIGLQATGNESGNHPLQQPRSVLPEQQRAWPRQPAPIAGRDKERDSERELEREREGDASRSTLSGAAAPGGRGVLRQRAWSPAGGVPGEEGGGKRQRGGGEAGLEQQSARTALGQSPSRLSGHRAGLAREHPGEASRRGANDQTVSYDHAPSGFGLRRPEHQMGFGEVSPSRLAARAHRPEPDAAKSPAVAAGRAASAGPPPVSDPEPEALKPETRNPKPETRILDLEP